MIIQQSVPPAVLNLITEKMSLDLQSVQEKSNEVKVEEIE